MSTFRMQQRRGTTANCSACTDIIKDGEIIVEKCSGGVLKIKIGDGTHKFSELPYVACSDTVLTLLEKSKLTNFNTEVAAIKVTNAGTSDKVANSLTIGGKTFDGSSAISVSASDLGIANAMHFIGRATVTITDGSVTDPVISGYDFSKKQAGDVILDKDGKIEYCWTGSAWEDLGDGNSYVVKETGKGLSTNDFTNALKNKLDALDPSGGAIDTIEVNGVEQTIVDKTVDITVPTKTSDLTNDSNFVTSSHTHTSSQITDVTVATTTDLPDISGKENTSNKVTSLSSSSTDTQYPSAKSVYDFVIANRAIPINVSTEAEMTALLVAANVGKVYRFVGTTTATYTNGEIYIVEET